MICFWSRSFGVQVPGGGGGGGEGTCQNFDRDARSIFFGFEIWPNPIFLGWQIF